MKNILTLFLAFVLVYSTFAQQAQGLKSNYFELRIYTAHEGKMPDLVKRFQNHTAAIFEKVGMENVAYFLPVDESDNTLTYILGYPDVASRDIMWEKFLNDPEWKKAYQESIVNGPLVKEIKEIYMTLAPELNNTPKPSPSGIFQLRTYYCHEGRLDNLLARFRDHTQALFEKQGLRNYPYFLTVEKDGAQSKLVYLLGHESQPAYEQAFQAFIKDPEWIKARDASESDGKIVEKVDAKFLKTLSFSPMK